MSSIEFIVVVFGLIIGYWIVSQFGAGNKANKARSKTSSTANDSAYWQPEQDERAAQETLHGSQAAESSSSEHWSAVLKISANANIDEIRYAYKTLISQYHPDKVATLGTELKELCEQKTKEINAAYRRALAEHGDT